MRLSFALLSLLCLGLLCQPAPPDATRTWEGDQAALAALRAEIDTLVADRTCAGSGSCAAIAFGHKTCGGPSDYVVYSRATVDEAALQDRARRYTDLEQYINLKYGFVSDCYLVTVPDVTCDDGMCVEAPPP